MTSTWQGHVLISLFCVLLLVSCRDQDVRPRTDNSATRPTTQAFDSHAAGSGSATDQLRETEEERPLATTPTAAEPVRPSPVGKSVSAVSEPPSVPRFSRKSEVYDRQGEGFALLQSPHNAMKQFPADSQGKVDWVTVLEKGLIRPRASLSGNGTMKRRFDDIVMRETRDMPWVKFPHAQHTEWLDCTNCHPKPFNERKGSNQISMETIMRGQHYGTCHDRVAFSIFACERCHSVPHAESPAKWW